MEIKRITINAKNGATVKAAGNADAVRQTVTATVKPILRRFYLRGRHPNSLRNLKPRRKGMPSLNPAGRRGARSLQSELEAIIFSPAWQEFRRQTEETERLLARSVREHLGISLKEL